MNAIAIPRHAQVRRLAGVGLLVLLSGTLQAGAAPSDELPHSSACQTALRALDDAESALAAAGAASAAAAPPDGERQRAAAARLQPLRQRVADACLGGLTTSPPPSQRTWIAPPPPRAAAQPPRLPPARLPDPVPLPRPEAPITINHCNAATCLGSDGSTLTRVGPNLVGPRGVCTVQGVFLRCP